MSDDDGSDEYWRSYEAGWRDADAERKAARADESRQLPSNSWDPDEIKAQAIREVKSDWY